MVGEHCSAVEGIPKGVLEVLQELMLTRVAKNKVRNLVAENLRFPEVKLICSGLVDP
jgi:hypothetical protein